MVNCAGEADNEIARLAINFSSENSGPCVVVADDTDIAVMLLYHWTSNMADIFFLQERSNQVWSVKESQRTVKDLKEHLLFLHSWTGCDSTSAICGKTKVAVAKIITVGKCFKHFYQPQQHTE